MCKLNYKIDWINRFLVDLCCVFVQIKEDEKKTTKKSLFVIISIETHMPLTQRLSWMDESDLISYDVLLSLPPIWIAANFFSSF